MAIQAGKPPGETPFVDKLASFKVAVEQLQKFTEKHEERDNRMAYIEDLATARSEEWADVNRSFEADVLRPGLPHATCLRSVPGRE